MPSLPPKRRDMITSLDTREEKTESWIRKSLPAVAKVSTLALAGCDTCCRCDGRETGE